MPAQYPDAEACRRTVLVAVINNAADLRRAAAEGWYRIPQRRAPPRIGADYLAFYQTAAFNGQEEAQTVTYYAATRRYRLMTRRELLPEEGGHPRAADYYYRVEIGPLQRLAQPVPATTFRRITFIHTTLDRLFTAQDVRDLFRHDDPFDRLWQALREHRLRPLKNRLVGERPVDITLRARGGYLGVNCVEDVGAQERGQMALSERWEILNLSTARIAQDLDACLRQIGAALITLGGSVLNAPEVKG
jgi:very-short-patch-repair endonuclease